MFKIIKLAVLLSLINSPSLCLADGVLSDNIRIHSNYLGYDLHYRVYQPNTIAAVSPLPVVFVTDGQYYLDELDMPEVMSKLVRTDAMKPVFAVFVDSRNPDKPYENRRDQQFMCNQDYALFFVNELLPTIQSKYPVSDKLQDRLIMGVSFGGINAACFGILLPQVFNNLAMHSPASNKHMKVIAKLYEESEKLPLRIFLSVGTGNDSTTGVRRFKRVLDNKGYDVNYKEVPFGHESDNWRPLIDDALLTFFRK
jgi:enterochelin esterase-like enzyme